MLTVRMAEKSDYDNVMEFYYSLIEVMTGTEFDPGWRKDVYPTREFIGKSINNGELYIAEENGSIAGCMVVNHEYNEGYNAVNWSVHAESSELLVIHALGVHPVFSGKGIAKQMVRRVIDIAGENGIKAIRLDVLGGNIPAERVYTKMGFEYRDTVKMFYEDTGWTDYRIFEYVV